MTRTHQYICDKDCMFFEEKKDDIQQEYLYCKKAKCNIHYSWRMMSALNGCASHSDFQSERDKMLDELIRQCKLVATTGENPYKLKGWLPMGAIEGIVAELRQAGEQG
jgi:hypothetical protein